MPFYFIAFSFGSDFWVKKLIYFNHHILSRIYLTLIGIIVKIEGREHLDKNQSYMIVSNHRSSLDFVVNAMAFPGIYRFLAKKELSKIPLLGYVIKHTCVLVDRSSMMSRAKSVIRMKDFLKNGYSIFVYPEGSRNTTTELIAPFYDGAFKLAISAEIPVISQTILNMRAIAGAGKSIEMRPGIIRIQWAKPILVKKTDDANELKNIVRNKMIVDIEQYQNSKK